MGLAQGSLDSSAWLHETCLDSTATPLMGVSGWLRDLGLENHTQAFHANDINAVVLPRLTADDLAALGITSSDIGASSSTPLARSTLLPPRRLRAGKPLTPEYARNCRRWLKSGAGQSGDPRKGAMPLSGRSA
jgi:hypothetical protein